MAEPSGGSSPEASKSRYDPTKRRQSDGMPQVPTTKILTKSKSVMENLSESASTRSSKSKSTGSSRKSSKDGSKLPKYKRKKRNSNSEPTRAEDEEATSATGSSLDGSNNIYTRHSHSNSFSESRASADTGYSGNLEESHNLDDSGHQAVDELCSREADYTHPVDEYAPQSSPMPLSSDISPHDPSIILLKGDPIELHDDLTTIDVQPAQVQVPQQETEGEHHKDHQVVPEPKMDRATAHSLVETMKQSTTLLLNDNMDRLRRVYDGLLQEECEVHAVEKEHLQEQHEIDSQRVNECQEELQQVNEKFQETSDEVKGLQKQLKVKEAELQKLRVQLKEKRQTMRRVVPEDPEQLRREEECNEYFQQLKKIIPDLKELKDKFNRFSSIAEGRPQTAHI